MQLSHAERYVAFDLGAESGRVMLGSLDDGRLELNEIHRFANGPVRVLDSLYWNVWQLWQEMKHGLSLAGAAHGRRVDGIAVDSWAQDFALLDERGELLALPHSYRDSRTQGIVEVLHEAVSDWELYQRTGLPGFEISTLSQLLAMHRQGSPALAAAQTLLFLPGLFTFWLSGQQANEASIAGISQTYNLARGDWDRELLALLQLPASLPAPIVPTATVAGTLLESVAQEVGLHPVPVIATAGHDTAAAVAALPEPAGQQTITFISSGTWSVIGRELETPLISAQAMERGFLNEVGACGRILFAYNSMGLWPVQQCRRTWQRAGKDWSYAELIGLASQAPPFATILNPDDAVFAQPGDILARLADFCRRTGQPMPETPGSVVRSFLEGLALRYRKVVEDLTALTGRPTDTIHIIGGGSRNELLCQLTADATGCPVLAGPAEATAAGTVLLQALARGRLSSLGQVKEVSARSCRLVGYEPHPAGGWDEHYAAFLRLAG